MAKLSTTEVNKYCIGLWGKPNIGKTVLASQFPQLYFVDLDDGLGSVISLKTKLGLDFDFDAITIDETETTDEDYIQLCGTAMAKKRAFLKAKKLIEVLCRKLPQDTTLVIDNTSRLSEFLVYDIEKSSGNRPLQIQDWGTFTNEIRDIIGYIKSAKCNVIIISHEEYQKDEGTKQLERHLLMPTKMRYRIPSVVSDFLYMSARPKGAKARREVVRYLQSTPDQMTATGSRALIPDIENPTYDKLKPYLEKALNRKLPNATWAQKED